MSKATTRNSELSPDVHELRDDELDHVSGGRTIPNGRIKWNDIGLKRS